MGEAKRQAANVADAASTGGRKTASSFENGGAGDHRASALRSPVAIGVGIGWLIGRLHRPF